MSEQIRIYCNPLGSFIDVPEKPKRIVSLVSGLTEALFEIGYGAQIVGVSSYCSRYVPNLSAPVVGDYLVVDEGQIKQLEPDLVLTTTGVQRGLGKKLSEHGFPVYAFPLPNSLHGILENIITLGGLVDEMDSARALTRHWRRVFLDLAAGAPSPRPRVYAECWFGKHVRMVGGFTFINDLLEAAGCENIFANQRQGYLELDLDETTRRRPDLMVLFTEPEYPVDANKLLQQRGWQGVPVIESNVTRGMNLIHDGPSMMETAAWLQKQIIAKWN